MVAETAWLNRTTTTAAVLAFSRIRLVSIRSCHLLHHSCLLVRPLIPRDLIPVTPNFGFASTRSSHCEIKPSRAQETRTTRLVNILATRPTGPYRPPSPSYLVIRQSQQLSREPPDCCAPALPSNPDPPLPTRGCRALPAFLPRTPLPRAVDPLGPRSSSPNSSSGLVTRT